MGGVSYVFQTVFLWYFYLGTLYHSFFHGSFIEQTDNTPRFIESLGTWNKGVRGVRNPGKPGPTCIPLLLLLITAGVGGA